jgi:hypothetical protein
VFKRRWWIGLAVLATVAAVGGAVPAVADDGDEPCIWMSVGTLSLSRSTALLGETVALRWSASTWCSIITLSGPGFNGGEGVGTAGIRELAPDGGGTWTLSVWSRDTGVGRPIATLQSPTPQLQGGVSSVGSLIAVGRDGNGVSVAFADSPGLKRVPVQPGSPGGDFVAGEPWDTPDTTFGLAAGNDADGRPVLAEFDGYGNLSVWYRTVGAAFRFIELDGKVSSVALASHANGRLALFATTPAGRIVYRSQTAANSDRSWSGWSELPGELRDITAKTNANGRIELFGVNRDGAIFHATQTAANSNAWSPWEQFPGALFSITAALNQDGKLEVFGVNKAGELYHQKQTAPGGPTWTGWSRIFNPPMSRVSAETAPDGRIVIVGRRSNGTIGFDWQPVPNAPGLTGSWHPIASFFFRNTVFGTVNAPVVTGVTRDASGLAWLNWRDQSTNEEGFRVLERDVNGTWGIRRGIVSINIAGTGDTNIVNLAPGSCLAIAALNSESMAVTAPVCG